MKNIHVTWSSSFTFTEQMSLLTRTNRSTAMEWTSEAAMRRGVLFTLVPDYSSTSAEEWWPYRVAMCIDDKLSWWREGGERGNKMCKGELEVMRSVKWFFIIFIPFHLTWGPKVCTNTVQHHQVWILQSSDSLYSMFEAHSILVIEKND